MDILDRVIEIYNYGLLTIKGRELRVNQILFALLIMGLGFLLAHIFSKMARHSLSALKLSDNNQHFFSKLIWVFTVGMTALIALEIIHIPLSSFSFVGGCLALGIGFGIKNLINNFVCGFILLGERPIKIGDVVEIEDQIGVVETVGLRCTKVHTEDNIHIIYPNSQLLEEKLINWSYNDHQILAYIEVGLAYDSDTRKACEKMIEAVKQLKGVHAKPEPFTLFWETAASTLIFRLYFPLTARCKMDKWKLQSEARHLIFNTLREEGFVFSFPQLDVHFDEQRDINSSDSAEISS